MNCEREMLIEIIGKATYYGQETFGDHFYKGVLERLADQLLENGVIVTPCMAMVEQFLKDGKLDRRRTAHNGRIAIVYIDKSKSGMPLIDITEQHYNVDKAVERIKLLKGGA